MDDEPKINFPTVRNGKIIQAAPASISNPASQGEPKIKFPTLQQQVQATNDGTRARLRGLTLGLSDRVEALVKPGKYEDNLKQQFADRDAYAGDKPWSNIGNELLGGVASGGAISNGMKAGAAKILPKVAEYAKGVGLGPLATRIMQPLAEAGTQGEVASQAQKPYGEVGNEVGTGALYGAGAGAVGTVGLKLGGTALKSMSRVGQRIALAMGAVKPEDFATRKYIESLAAKGLEPEEITTALKYLRGDDLAQHGPVTSQHNLPDLSTPVRVADVAPPTTMGVFAKWIKSSDHAAANVADQLANRNAEQGMRLQNHVGGTLSNDMDSTAVNQALVAQRAAAADPHYKAAYAVGSPNDPIVDQWINDRPVNAKIFQSLETNLKQNASQGMGNGRPMAAQLNVNPTTGLFEWKQRPTIEDLDTIKKHIDAKLNDLWNPTKNQYNMPKNTGDADAGQLRDQRDDLVNMINKLTPDGKGGSHYENARTAFADDSEIIDAHRAGQTVMRTRPEDVALQFDKFQGKPELENQYRAGIASVIKDLVDKSDTGGGAAIVRKLYGSPGIQQKLEHVMANPATNDQFSRNMAAEKAMVDTQRTLTPKSSGQDLLGDAEGFSLPLAAVNAMSGRFGAAANQMGRFGTGSISGMAPEVGDDLARIAMMNPEEHGNWVNAYRASQNTPGQKAARAMGALTQYTADGIPTSMAVTAGMLPKQGSLPPPDDQ